MICHISVKPILLPITPRPNFRLANWDSYAEEIKLKYNDPAIIENPTLEEIDEYIEDCYTTIETAVRNNIPYTTHRTILLLLLLLLLNTTEKAEWDERKRYKLPDDNPHPP